MHKIFNDSCFYNKWIYSYVEDFLDKVASFVCIIPETQRDAIYNYKCT